MAICLHRFALAPAHCSKGLLSHPTRQGAGGPHMQALHRRGAAPRKRTLVSELRKKQKLAQIS